MLYEFVPGGFSLEQLESKLEKILGFRNMLEKFEKGIYCMPSLIICGLYI